MSNLGAFAGFMLICAILPFAVSYGLTKLRPAWRGRTITLLAALPLPSAIWLFCGWIYLTAALASEQECGVDACGMAMMASFFVAVGTAPGFFVGLGAAWLARQWALK